MNKLFGTDGVRGIANSELTCELALNIGRAAAMSLSQNRREKPKILIGKDTRLSSDMLEGALKSGICSAGVNAVVVGVIPTPGIAYLVRAYGADAGIMISASHNPYQFNGIKIFDKDGYKISRKIEEEIEKATFEDVLSFKYPLPEDIGYVSCESDAIYDYVNHIKSVVSEDLSGMKIAVDCANGASCETAEHLFKDLGVECHMLFNTPDGVNINNHCGSTHMDALCEYVVNHNMDLGIAFDGDADRCLAVDENGCVADGDTIMAICALDMLERGKLSKNTVVGTIMTNMGFSEFCNKSGIKFEAANVGDRCVLENMLCNGYNFGGEQSGHVIFKDFSTTGDGQLTAVKLLEVLKRRNQSLGEARKIMSNYPQTVVNISVSRDKKELIHSDSDILKILSDAQNSLDGSGRIIVRESGTEPLVRVMVESIDIGKTHDIANSVAGKISQRLESFT